MRKKSILIIAAAAVCLFLAYTSYARFFHQPDLTVVGFIDLADGVGRQSLELIDTFKNDCSVNFIPTRPSKLSDVSCSLKRIVRKNYRKLGKVIIFEDLLWWPGENKYQKIGSVDAQDSIKIAYSMVESSKIPNEWALILNKHFDAVVVPDRFLIEVYQKSGVTIPVFELPLGLDLTPMLSAPLKTKPNTPFVFGNLSGCSDRKNQLLLVRAFAQAFGDDPHIQLRINSRAGEKEVSHELTAEIEKLGYSNINFTRFRLERDDYLELFKKFDCYVNISKGEGFSIQPREAMALGIPVIATSNSAQKTICDSGLVRSISCPYKEVAVYPWGDHHGFFLNCTIDDVAEALKDVYARYEVYLHKAEQARKWASTYQYKNMKPLYATLIKPKKVVLCSENKITPEGLFTSSESLFKKYQSLIKDDL